MRATLRNSDLPNLLKSGLQALPEDCSELKERFLICVNPLGIA